MKSEQVELAIRDIEADVISELTAGKYYDYQLTYDDLKSLAAYVRELEAGKTCVWTAHTVLNYNTSCNRRRVKGVAGEFCPYCGGKIEEKQDEKHD